MTCWMCQGCFQHYHRIGMSVKHAWRVHHYQCVVDRIFQTVDHHHLWYQYHQSQGKAQDQSYQTQRLQRTVHFSKNWGYIMENATKSEWEGSTMEWWTVSQPARKIKQNKKTFVLCFVDSPLFSSKYNAVFSLEHNMLYVYLSDANISPDPDATSSTTSLRTTFIPWPSANNRHENRKGDGLCNI